MLNVLYLFNNVDKCEHFHRASKFRFGCGYINVLCGCRLTLAGWLNSVTERQGDRHTDRPNFLLLSSPRMTIVFKKIKPSLLGHYSCIKKHAWNGVSCFFVRRRCGYFKFRTRNQLSRLSSRKLQTHGLSFHSLQLGSSVPWLKIIVN